MQYTSAAIQDLGLNKLLQKLNFGLWVFFGTILAFGTKLGLFWDHFGTGLVLLVDIFIKNATKLTKKQTGFKRHVVTTFSTQNCGLFGEHFRTFKPDLRQNEA